MDYCNWQLDVRLMLSSILELCSVRLQHVDFVLLSLHFSPYHRAENSQEAGERALTGTYMESGVRINANLL